MVETAKKLPDVFVKVQVAYKPVPSSIHSYRQDIRQAVFAPAFWKVHGGYLKVRMLLHCWASLGANKHFY